MAAEMVCGCMHESYIHVYTCTPLDTKTELDSLVRNLRISLFQNTLILMKKYGLFPAKILCCHQLEPQA